MENILTVLGTRPQFIRASVLRHVIAAAPDLTKELIHTGQYFDANMPDVLFDELGMKKLDQILDIHSGTHCAMTGRMLTEVEQVLLAEKSGSVQKRFFSPSALRGLAQ